MHTPRHDASLTVVGLQQMVRIFPDPDLDLPDPDPAPDPSIMVSSKNSKKNLDSYCVVTSFGFFILEKLCKSTFNT
jgi:hypothetical protein